MRDTCATGARRRRDGDAPATRLAPGRPPRTPRRNPRLRVNRVNLSPVGGVTTPRILIIAGSDSGGGAGIQADVKTVTMLGGHAMTAITAITAQNTLGVQAVHPVPAEMVVAQMRSCLDDIGVDAIKIGMIGSAETANAVAEVLERLTPRFHSVTPVLSRGPTSSSVGQGSGTPGQARGDEEKAPPAIPIVLDPVMVATSGSILADAATIAAFARLMRVATLVTPNLPELDALGGEAEVLAHGCALLVKGGHAEGDTITDRLVDHSGEVARWSAPRIDTPHSHGTGCTLASAIAVGLAHGLPLPQAIERARVFVRLALHAAPGHGGGHGPMGHGDVRLDATLPGAMLNQLTLPMTDAAATRAFYQLLGLRLIVDAEPRYARCETAGGATLSVEAADELDGRPLAFFECNDLDGTVARLRGGGVAVTEPQLESWGWREARLADPFGNPLCLYQAGENRRFPPWRVR